MEAPELALVPKQEIITNAVDRVRILAEIVRALKDTALTSGLDYGIIPGTGDKPTLLLPGMEKFMRALNAVPDYIERRVIVDYDKPLFHYEYECRLVDAETGLAIPGGRGLGLCTSYESSFRWRTVPEHELPASVDKSQLQATTTEVFEFDFAIDKAETTGKYGKPAEYWQKFKNAMADGTAIASARTTSKGTSYPGHLLRTTAYRVENPAIFDQVNSIMKRAKKRALGDAIKGAANVSEFFTVDLEDLPHHEFDDPDVVEGEVVEEKATPPKQAQTRKEANRINTGVNDKPNGWPPAQEDEHPNGDTPQANVNNKVASIRERTGYLYPDVKFSGHHNKSILALIADGVITPDSSNEQDDIALLERLALKDHKMDHDDLMILLSGHRELCLDWGDWIAQGKTLQDAWAIILEANAPAEEGDDEQG